MAVKIYSLASFGMIKRLIHAVLNAKPTAVMLFYDIVITFGEEVEHIWKKKFTCFTTLWFLVCCPTHLVEL